MKSLRILWADDEIDLLTPHIQFLEKRGYIVQTALSGGEAIEKVNEESFDIIFLDENMPGLTGLETLNKIKTSKPGIPVIMITKSEEENIMDLAVGSKIADYLIKPVNPNQILLSIKKNIDQRRLVSEKTTTDYQAEFTKIGLRINDAREFQDWVDIYKDIAYWEIELEESDKAMDEVLHMQKSEANSAFAKYIRKHYEDWFEMDEPDRPMLSHELFKKKVFPLLEKGEKTALIVIDNFRYDQWIGIRREISGLFNMQEEIYCSILPTATMYARNAIFAGLMPEDIANMYPQYWVHEDDERGKNLMEKELIGEQLSRYRKKHSFAYEKINDSTSFQKILDNFSNLLQNDLIAIVVNFVDMLSHAKTDTKMIKELAPDDAAFRSLSHSWFLHSPMAELFRMLAAKNIRVVLTTDHGTIRVQNPVKVIGDRNTNTNLRYKMGRNLNFNQKQAFGVSQPESIKLPKLNISSSFVFATSDDFLVYPNNYNYYANYFKNTYQHGGISLEEMLVPLVVMNPK